MNDTVALDPAVVRDVVVGSHSVVWRSLLPSMRALGASHQAIGHRDIPRFAFGDTDRVWVLSFSRDPAENAGLLARLREAGVRELVYVSSSSTIVGERTDCYRYPRAKRLAELDALALPNARVLTIGLMYESPEELPGGASIATSYRMLSRFMEAPDWSGASGRRKLLFEVVHRPFASPAERAAQRWYGRLITAAGRHPCLLRPIDLVLRAFGIRWYGYVYLSNTLWISTIS